MIWNEIRYTQLLVGAFTLGHHDGLPDQQTSGSPVRVRHKKRSGQFVHQLFSLQGVCTMNIITNRVVSSVTMFALLCACLLPVSSAVAAPITNMAPNQTAQVRAQSDQIDINDANLNELQSLPGIGKVFSKKIVASRPYQSVEDLQTRKVLPIKTYQKIHKMLVIRSKE